MKKMNIETIKNATVNELRELCREYGEQVSGTKKLLQNRLYKFAEEVNPLWFVLYGSERRCYRTFITKEEAEKFYISIKEEPTMQHVVMWTPADFVMSEESIDEYKLFIDGYICEDKENPVWWNLVCEMNMKDGQPFVYEHVADRPLLQQIMLNVCRDLYLDAQRAVKVSNGDKSVKQFGPTFVSKKHNSICMKDAMAKGAVKSAAEKVLSKEQQKKFIVLNTETKHKEFKQAVQILNKLDAAGLISGKETDKDYAKFYSVEPNEILSFLQAVGCLKK